MTRSADDGELLLCLLATIMKFLDAEGKAMTGAEGHGLGRGVEDAGLEDCASGGSSGTKMTTALSDAFSLRRHAQWSPRVMGPEMEVLHESPSPAQTDSLLSWSPRTP